jgi:hypothetical protein
MPESFTGFWHVKWVRRGEEEAQEELRKGKAEGKCGLGGATCS